MPTMYGVAAIVLVFLGEALSIVAELLASKKFGSHSFAIVFALGALLITVGGMCLVLGYMLGYQHLKNIWIIFAVSVGSIVVIEPLLAYGLFRQPPTLGALVGLGLGLAGIVAALVF